MSEQFNLNNRYQFMGLIGKGHFGDVYRAADNFFRRDVAPKMLRKEKRYRSRIRWVWISPSCAPCP